MPPSALPLRGISVFEAAARLGSFRLAAAELNLTPSAVSHQVRLLEQVLGVKLFRRTGRGVSLSDDGAEYARTVRQGFRALRHATDDMSRRGRAGRLREIVSVQTPPSFASRWLLPRLPRFLAKYPGIEIRVNAEAGHRSKAGDADLMIVYGDTSRWMPQPAPFLNERIQPLCAASLVTSGKISAPADLARQVLIKTRDNALSWEAWFRQQGVDQGRVMARAIQLDPSHVAIEAAVNGLGVILESDILTREEVATGKLVGPFPETGATLSSYWLMPPPAKSERDAVSRVRRWLKRETGS
jgi:LysR family transcriptional regulator, glycine cleavage system transcriptional activator